MKGMSRWISSSSQSLFSASVDPLESGDAVTVSTREIESRCEARGQLSIALFEVGFALILIRISTREDASS